MSKMKELYDKVSKDAVLQEKFSRIVQDAESAGEEKTGEKLLDFACESGFSISLEEMQDFFWDLMEKKDGQLSDAELDLVAGGKSVIGGVGIALTVISFGIGCAMVSAIEAAHHADCGRMYQ